MSDTSQGPGWWIASDGKWYSPEQKPGPATPEPPAPVAAAPETPAPATPEPAPTAAPVTPTPVTPPPFAPETPPAAVEPPTEPIPVTPPPMAAPAMAPPPTTPPPTTPPPMGAPPVPPPGTPPPMMTPPAGGYAAAPTMVADAPPAKKGNGCLKAALIVGAIIVVLGIGTFIALAFLVNKGVDTVNSKLDAQKKVEQRTGISSSSFNTEHPPQDDLAGDWKCSTNSGGFPQVTGSVKNNSSHASTYTITVEFRQDGTQFTTGSGIIVSVDPGQSADFSATGAVEPSGKFTCKVDSIDRFDTSASSGN